MPRGMGGQSPSNITHHLKGIDFPADKDELLRHAEENGAGQAILDVLSEMPDDEYESMADVTKAYREAKDGETEDDEDRVNGEDS